MSFIFYTLSIVQFAKEFEEATDKKQYIEDSLPLIKDEIESNSIDVQKKGIQKLLFCEMFGVHKNWAEFRVTELIANKNYQISRTCHVAAQCLLSRSSPLTLILVNLLQKELSDANPYKVGMALTLISSIANKDLANELLPTVTDLFQSNNCYIKVRAIICATVLVHYLPELYQSIYVSFRDLIKDDEPQIIHTTLSVLCELVSRHITYCEDILSILLQILIDHSDVSCTIKVMKLFSLLLPQEQRLVVKIMKPLIEMTEITENTSILYESLSLLTQCVAIIQNNASLANSIPSYVKIPSIIASKLKLLLKSSSINDQYLGLKCAKQLMRINKSCLQKESSSIYSLIISPDSTFRSFVKDILQYICDADLYYYICNKYVHGISVIQDDTIRNESISFILMTGKDHNYKNIRDFSWYISTLVVLLQYKSLYVEEIIVQFKDICSRVEESRDFLIAIVSIIIQNLYKYIHPDNLPIVMDCFFSLLGQYCTYIQEDRFLPILSLFTYRQYSLSEDSYEVCLLSCFKMFTFYLFTCKEITKDIEQLYKDFFSVFLEYQETVPFLETAYLSSLAQLYSYVYQERQKGTQAINRTLGVITDSNREYVFTSEGQGGQKEQPMETFLSKTEYTQEMDPMEKEEDEFLHAPQFETVPSQGVELGLDKGMSCDTVEKLETVTIETEKTAAPAVSEPTTKETAVKEKTHKNTPISASLFSSSSSSLSPYLQIYNHFYDYLDKEVVMEPSEAESYLDNMVPINKSSVFTNLRPIKPIAEISLTQMDFFTYEEIPTPSEKDSTQNHIIVSPRPSTHSDYFSDDMSSIPTTESATNQFENVMNDQVKQLIELYGSKKAKSAVYHVKGMSTSEAIQQMTVSNSLYVPSNQEVVPTEKKRRHYHHRHHQKK